MIFDEKVDFYWSRSRIIEKLGFFTGSRLFPFGGFGELLPVMSIPLPLGLINVTDRLQSNANRVILELKDELRLGGM